MMLWFCDEIKVFSRRRLVVDDHQLTGVSRLLKLLFATVCRITSPPHRHFHTFNYLIYLPFTLAHSQSHEYSRKVSIHMGFALNPWKFAPFPKLLAVMCKL